MAAPEICVVSTVGAWPHPNSGKRSNPRIDQKLKLSLTRRIALPISSATPSPKAVGFPKVPSSGASSRFARGVFSRFYRINSKPELNRIYQVNPSVIKPLKHSKSTELE
jgi:hypothetical protein